MSGVVHRPVYLNASTGTGSTYASPATDATLDKVIVGTGTASAVVTVYAAPTSLGATVATIDASAKGYYDFCDTRFPAGFSVYQTGAAGKITLIVG